MSMQERQRRTQRSRRRRAWRRLSTISFILGILLLAACIYLSIGANREIQEKQDIRDLYYGMEINQAERFALIPTAKADGEAPEGMQPDFAGLYELNPDVMGWLKAGEEIDGPVMYRDNAYYMNRSITGGYSQHGELFIDEENGEWATDKFLILYGHNMKNGQMFGGMKKFRDPAYMQQHPVIELRTLFDEVPRQYVPFALFDASMVEKDDNFFKLRRFDIFHSEEGEIASEEKQEAQQAYLDDVLARSMFAIGVDVTIEDNILVLVTCSYDDPDGRMMIFCRQLREDERILMPE